MPDDPKGSKPRRVSAFLVDPSDLVVDYSDNTRSFPPTYEEVETLIESILQFGQQQPVEVRKLPDGRYKLVAGYRRYTAITLINERGLREPPIQIQVVVRDINGHEAFLRAIAENEERQSHSPLDQARIARRLKQDYGMSETEIGRVFHRSQAWVSRILRVLSLSDELQRMLHFGQITLAAAIRLTETPEEGREEMVRAILATRRVDEFGDPVAQDERSDSGRMSDITPDAIASPSAQDERETPRETGRVTKPIGEGDIKRAAKAQKVHLTGAMTMRDFKTFLDQYDGPGTEEKARKILQALRNLVNGTGNWTENYTIRYIESIVTGGNGNGNGKKTSH